MFKIKRKNEYEIKDRVGVKIMNIKKFLSYMSQDKAVKELGVRSIFKLSDGMELTYQISVSGNDTEESFILSSGGSLVALDKNELMKLIEISVEILEEK